MAITRHYMVREKVYKSDAGVEVWQCPDCPCRWVLVSNQATVVYAEGEPGVKHWLDISGRVGLSVDVNAS